MTSPYEHSPSTNQYTLSHKFFGASVCYSAPFFQVASKDLLGSPGRTMPCLRSQRPSPNHRALPTSTAHVSTFLHMLGHLL